MQNIIVGVLILMLLINGGQSKKSKDDKLGKETFCHEEAGLIGWKKEGATLVVLAKESSSVTFQCSFCGQKPNREPKIWAKMELNGSKNIEEIDTLKNSRFSENFEKSLTIQNVSKSDCGFYMCSLPYDHYLEDSLNYLLDIFEDVDSNSTAIHSGDWLSYSLKYLVPINSNLSQYYYQLGEDYGVMHFEVLTVWTEWSICDVCVSNPTRRKSGVCQVILVPASNSSSPVSQLESNVSETLKQLLSMEGTLPCKGRFLNQLLPGIAGMVKEIPDMLIEESCPSHCPIGKGRGRSGPLFREKLTKEEGSNFIVVCPKVNEEHAGMKWTYRKRDLNIVDMDGMVTIDHFGSLHFSGITDVCTGEYTCFSKSKGIRILELHLVVRKVKKLRWDKDLSQHVLYLTICSALSLLVFSIIICGMSCRKSKISRNYDDLKTPLLLEDSDMDQSGSELENKEF